ncbi:MAG: hypothetical protein ACRC7O_06380, partial [Fimbriiglobus sp.]
MSFRDFTFPKVVTDLGLTVSDDTNLFPDPKPRPLRPELLSAIQEGVELAQGLNNEKARSEFLIAPLMLELRRLAGRRFGLFSGVELNVDPARGLNGVCDFLVTRAPRTFLLTAPILAVVEAKNDNVWTGFGQCVATMVAAAEFNRAAAVSEPIVYGTATTGTNWKFLRLVGDRLTIDIR